MDTKLSYQEFKEKVSDNLVTFKGLCQIIDMFPDKLIESNGDIIEGFRVCRDLEDNMVLKAQNGDWPEVFDIAKKLNNFDKKNTWYYFYESDTVHDKPLKMKDILK